MSPVTRWVGLKRSSLFFLFNIPFLDTLFCFLCDKQRGNEILSEAADTRLCQTEGLLQELVKIQIPGPHPSRQVLVSLGWAWLNKPVTSTPDSDVSGTLNRI